MLLPSARHQGLTIRELPEETLVYDLERHKAHCLNRAASLVWRHCDGHTTVADMAHILREELDLPADEALVGLALEQLAARHLLQQPATALEESERRSRRAVLKKLAVVAASLPVVMTLTAKAAGQFISVVKERRTIDCTTPDGKAGQKVIEVTTHTTNNKQEIKNITNCIPNPEQPTPAPTPSPSPTPTPTPCGTQNMACTGAGQGTCCAGCDCLGGVCSC